MAPAVMFIILIVGLLILFTYFIPIRLWVAAISSGAGVGLGELIGMRLRRVSPKVVGEPRISAVKAGVNLPTNQLEAHYLAGQVWPKPEHTVGCRRSKLLVQDSFRCSLPISWPSWIGMQFLDRAAPSL